MKKVFYKTLEISVPNGASVGTIINLTESADTNYNKITGVAFVRISGTDSINLGFRRANTDIIAPINYELLNSTSIGGSAEARFWKVDEDSRTGNVDVTAQPAIGTTGSVNIFQVVLRLEK